MRPARQLLLVLTLALAPRVGAQPAALPDAGPSPAPPTLLNVREPLPEVRTGGLPPETEIFDALAAEGFRVYVDLRSQGEGLDAARAAAETAGLAYVSIPVGGEAELDLVSVRALDAVLADPASRPVVIACASGNRSGALLALRAFWLEGASPEEALALGLRAGLTRLEPSVRTLLGLPPATSEPKKPD